VVPSSGLRTRDDVQTVDRSREATILIRERIQTRLFRGVASSTSTAMPRKGALVKKRRFAVARDLYLLAHCDEPALLILLATTPRPGSSGRIRLLDPPGG